MDNNCYSCKWFLDLKKPHTYPCNGYPEGVTVHGFCSKDEKTFSFYPVYIPYGVCKNYKHDNTRKNIEETQLTLF